jgi:hypothetical protein
MTTSASGRSLRADQLGYLEERFGQSGDRRAAVIIDEAAAGRREVRSTEAGDDKAGRHRLQFTGQRTGVQVSGRLTTGEQKAKAQDSGRAKSRASNVGLISSSVRRRS